MTQFHQEHYYGQPEMGPDGGEVKTSAMSITSLVLSLVGIIPCCGMLTAPIGAILGIIAFIRCSANPMLKGKGLALAGIVFGVIFTAAQFGGAYWLYIKFGQPIVHGPREAFTAASNGDIAGFKSQFIGAGATASDEEANAFVTEVERRYGKFIICHLQDNAQPPPAGSQQPNITLPYTFQFVNNSVTGEATYEFVDQLTGQLVQKWSKVVIHDPALGDLTYPPSAAVDTSADDSSDMESTDSPDTP